MWKTALVLFFVVPLHAFALEILPLRIGCPHWLTVRAVESRPEGTPVGDVLYLPGFADRADNHGPLFETWRRAGLRVLSLDYPSHGETRGIRGLDLYSFHQLGSLVLEVERRLREDPARPLVLAGWSTGGLLAARMIQQERFKAAGRRLSGAVLIAPGISVRPLVGEWGIVTERTLTRNPAPPHAGGPKPLSPFLKPIFAIHLLANAWFSRQDVYPGSLPTLLLTAGDDRYVRTDGVEEWAVNQIVQGGRLWGMRFQGAYHELDAEPAGVGVAARYAASEFARLAVGGLTSQMGSPQLVEAGTGEAIHGPSQRAVVLRRAGLEAAISRALAVPGGEEALVDSALACVRANGAGDGHLSAVLWEELAARIGARVGHPVSRSFRLPDGSTLFVGERETVSGRHTLRLYSDGRELREQL